MVIFLSGGGDAEDSWGVDEEFFDCVPAHGSLMYVPTAMPEDVYTYDECFAWFEGVAEDHGFDGKIEMEFDLVQEISHDAVYIGGGNTFFLLKEMKERGFDDALKDFILSGGIVYGGSAGAAVLGDTIRGAAGFDENEVGLEDLGGLGLLEGFDVWCHYETSHRERIEEYGGKWIVLREDCGVKVEDGELEAYGSDCLIYDSGWKETGEFEL